MTIFRKSLCPHCGQSIKGSFRGIHFSPGRYRILKAITDQPGITLERLGNRFYPESTNLMVIRTTITSINSLLASTNYRIKGPGYGKTEAGYRLVENREQREERKPESKIQYV